MRAFFEVFQDRKAFDEYEHHEHVKALLAASDEFVEPYDARGLEVGVP